MTETTRRAFLGHLAAGCGALTRPSRPTCPELEGDRIRWLVGAPPGGSMNRLSRLVEPGLEAALGADVVVENIAGAGGLVGAHRLSRARPDGRTVGLLGVSSLLLLPYNSPGHALDPERDFDVLTRLRDDRPILGVGTHLGVRTIEGLFRLDKPLVLGRTGPLGLSTPMAALFGRIFDIEAQLVDGYQGSGPLMAGVRRGEVDGLIVDEHTVARASGLVPLLRMTGGGDAVPREGQLPWLSGPGSIVDRRPDLLRDPSSSRELARAIQALVQAGRVVAVPRGLPPSLRRCLATAVFAAVVSPQVAESARREGQVMAPLPAVEARRGIAAARAAAARLGNALENLRRRGNR